MTKKELEQLKDDANDLGMNFTNCDKFYEIQYAVMNYHIIEADECISCQEVHNVLKSLAKRDIVALPPI